jgi:predicted RNA-binding protein with PUA-like domain
MKSWLVKTEPSAYSFQELCKDRRTAWDGVKNALALKHMARMQQGDRVIVYHTGGEKAAIGRARVVKAAYPDPALSDARWIVVDLAADDPLARPVTLAELKARSVFQGSDLVRLPRLSVMPLTTGQWNAIEAMARSRPAAS